MKNIFTPRLASREQDNQIAERIGALRKIHNLPTYNNGGHRCPTCNVELEQCDNGYTCPNCKETYD